MDPEQVWEMHIVYDIIHLLYLIGRLTISNSTEDPSLTTLNSLPTTEDQTLTTQKLLPAIDSTLPSLKMDLHDSSINTEHSDQKFTDALDPAGEKQEVTPTTYKIPFCKD